MKVSEVLSNGMTLLCVCFLSVISHWPAVSVFLFFFHSHSIQLVFIRVICFEIKRMDSWRFCSLLFVFGGLCPIVIVDRWLSYLLGCWFINRTNIYIYIREENLFFKFWNFYYIVHSFNYFALVFSLAHNNVQTVYKTQQGFFFFFFHKM